jgi:DNA-binding NtrC family response regulator
MASAAPIYCRRTTYAGTTSGDPATRPQQLTVWSWWRSVELRVRDDVPVILTSGHDEVETTRRFTSKAVAGFLQKPFATDDLAAKLTAALGPSE